MANVTTHARVRPRRGYTTPFWWFLYFLLCVPSVVAFLAAQFLLTYLDRFTVLGLLSVTYFGSAVVFDYYLRHGSWRRLKRWFTGYKNRVSTKRLTWALLAYFFALTIASFLYWWVAARSGKADVAGLLKGNTAYIVVTACLTSYLLGLVIRDVLRYRFRMFAAPLVLNGVLLFVILLTVLFPGSWSEWVKGFLEILKAHPWAAILAIILFKWSPQIGSILPRIQKAELPGGPKVEIAKIEELQQTINPWKKTVSRFADLMQWVSDLIEETPPEDTVKMFAYTPALGFLTRTEAEWQRLHRLLLVKNNIQIICLQTRDLNKWHESFENKQTARPEGVIKHELIERANRISSEIVADKKRQVDGRMTHVIEKRWDEMPGYYLFANSKRAIIAAPLFLPCDPNKPTTQTRGDNYLENMPVKMLGFESSDNWTVWLVNAVCDHYARTKSTPRTFAEAKLEVKRDDLDQWIKTASLENNITELLARFESSYKNGEGDASPVAKNGSSVELTLFASPALLVKTSPGTEVKKKRSQR
jgi:hypothetical protein